jgi:hypothetical protein
VEALGTKEEEIILNGADDELDAYYLDGFTQETLDEADISTNSFERPISPATESPSPRREIL